ncbi:MAG: hypothetical protein JWR20_1096 [Marmoricola sp.]|nr:hypothetical protein [Marmoricola sp.]
MSGQPGAAPTPAWLDPVVRGLETIRAEDISRFVPPEGTRTRKGAVLMLFGEGPQGPDLLLTERAHDMRSHPGQISFPGGSIDPEDASPVAAALREAQEETGLDPAGVEVLGTMPELWLPPSNFAVTTVVGWWRTPTPVDVVDPAEVHEVLRVPLEELLDPRHRVTVTHPRGYSSPGFMIGPGKDLVLWGFTAGLVNKLFDHVGWTRPWDAGVETVLPDYMLGLGRE